MNNAFDFSDVRDTPRRVSQADAAGLALAFVLLTQAAAAGFAIAALNRFGIREQITWISLAVWATLIYFMPMTVAIVRGHRQALAISVLNVLAGLTFFGWMGAMIWSLVVYDERGNS